MGGTRIKHKLTKEIDVNTFKNNYYLKEELIDFGRENGIKKTGSKEELTDRIIYFLQTGEVPEIEYYLNKKEKVSKKNTVSYIDEKSVMRKT